MACPLHRDRTAQPIDVVSKKFIDNVTHHGLVKLSGFSLLLETTAHLLILSLGVLNALRHVLKLSDEAYNAFLGLPIHLEQLEDSIGTCPLQLKQVKLLLSLISVLKYLIVLLLHVLNLAHDRLQLRLDLVEVRDQVDGVAVLVEERARDRLRLKLHLLAAAVLDLYQV